VAWHSLGFEPMWFAEIDKFPSAVLAQHYPDVPNYGDMTRIPDEAAGIDLLVGGTPCQSFSVAGLRGGMDDKRGNLALEYCRLAERFRPRWVVWENVAGVLHADEGSAFGSILGAMVELGYCCAWRVLDAQYFGVAQRRRRVFLVGHLGGPATSAAAVLFEPSSMSGDSPPCREEGEDIANTITTSSQRLDPETETLINAGGFARRIMPVECERLQGFPDNYTAIQYRGKAATDSPRYKALGNSMAVPVMRWIGERIAKVDTILKAGE